MTEDAMRQLIAAIDGEGTPDLSAIDVPEPVRVLVGALYDLVRAQLQKRALPLFVVKIRTPEWDEFCATYLVRSADADSAKRMVRDRLSSWSGAIEAAALSDEPGVRFHTASGTVL